MYRAAWAAKHQDCEIETNCSSPLVCIYFNPIREVAGPSFHRPAGNRKRFRDFNQQIQTRQKYKYTTNTNIEQI